MTMTYFRKNGCLCNDKLPPTLAEKSLQLLGNLCRHIISKRQWRERRRRKRPNYIRTWWREWLRYASLLFLSCATQTEREEELKTTNIILILSLARAKMGGKSLWNKLLLTLTVGTCLLILLTIVFVLVVVCM